MGKGFRKDAPNAVAIVAEELSDGCSDFDGVSLPGQIQESSVVVAVDSLGRLLA
jgi:hypothetical protein